MNKLSTNKFLYPVLCAMMFAVTIGCSSSSSCRPSSGNWFANCRLFRNPFKGDACSTCQPPMPQPANFGTNVSNNCEDGTCGLNVVVPEGQPANMVTPDQGIQYYGDQLNAPMNSAPIQTQGYPPAFQQTAPSSMNSSAPLNTEIESPPMYGFGN